MEEIKILYFYQAIQDIFSKKTSFDACEVEMTVKPKTYVSEKRIPMFGLGNRIRKEDVGKIMGYKHNTVVLEEKNDQLAKKILEEEYRGRLDLKMKEVKELEDIIETIRSWER